MRRLFRLLVVVAVFATPAFAQKSSVNGTVHDISLHTGAAESTTISCTNCHTPHISQASTPLFWARSFASTATFNAYTGNTVVTEVNITSPAAQDDPMWFSYLCMSCHDSGGSAADTFLGAVGLTFHFTPDTQFGGTTLETDHPVNFEYTAAAGLDFTTDYNAVAGGAVGNLPVFSGGTKTDTIQCASCHDVHASNYAFVVATPPAAADRTKFLRTPAGANLCLECHQ